jgi:hypothetical protein
MDSQNFVRFVLENAFHLRTSTCIVKYIKLLYCDFNTHKEYSEAVFKI